MKATNIQWDVDNETERALLPTEIEIPEKMSDDEEISDYLSAITGYCHYGYHLIDEKERKRV